MKNFRFDNICNITQEPKELRRYNCVCWFIGKSGVIKYRQLLLKVKCINRKSRFNQLAKASCSSTLKKHCRQLIRLAPILKLIL